MLHVVYFHLNYYNFRHIIHILSHASNFQLYFARNIFPRNWTLPAQVSPLSSTKIPTKRPKTIFGPKLGYNAIGFYNGIHIVSFYSGKYP